MSSYPMLVSEVMAPRAFPFQSWAASARFSYPAAALRFFRGCGSAAEAYFLRPFCLRPGVAFGDGAITCDGITVRLQVPCGAYRTDAVVSDSQTALAVEIDGIAFHQRSPQQVASDYQRQRRIVAAGYTVVRFTAQECFANAESCWLELDAILAARRA